MRNFDLIVFDIDGTLTRSKQVITEEMAALILKLLEQYKVAIISGAAYKQFEWQVLSKLGPDSNLEKLYLLPADGTVMCLDEGSWRCQIDDELTPEEKIRIKDSFDQALKKSGIAKPEKIYGDLVEDRGSQMNFSALGQDAPTELKEVWDPDGAKRLRIVEALKEVLPDFSFHIGGTTSIEATKPGIDKSYGLRKLTKQINVAEERVLYFGDKLLEGGNDYPVVSLGIKTKAVKGPEETKKAILELLE